MHLPFTYVMIFSELAMNVAIFIIWVEIHDGYNPTDVKMALDLTSMLFEVLLLILVTALHVYDKCVAKIVDTTGEIGGVAIGVASVL